MDVVAVVSMSPKSLLDELLGAVVMLLAITLGLTLAWKLLAPLLPVLGLGVLFFGVARFLFRRWRGDYW